MVQRHFLSVHDSFRHRGDNKEMFSAGVGTCKQGRTGHGLRAEGRLGCTDHELVQFMILSEGSRIKSMTHP